MEIDKKIIDSITAASVKKHWSCRVRMKEQGVNEIENNFRLATHKEFPNILFVVSTRNIYVGRVLDTTKYGLYAYSAKDGEAIADFSPERNCKKGFFKELNIISTII